MLRCYERTHYEHATGKRENFNHCGSAHVGDDGLDYCTTAGRWPGYFGICCCIKPKQMEIDWSELDDSR